MECCAIVNALRKYTFVCFREKIYEQRFNIKLAAGTSTPAYFSFAPSGLLKSIMEKIDKAPIWSRFQMLFVIDRGDFQ